MRMAKATVRTAAQLSDDIRQAELELDRVRRQIHGEPSTSPQVLVRRQLKVVRQALGEIEQALEQIA